NVAERANEYIWNAYRPFTDREFELLIGTLRDFDPDLIGFSLTSLTMKPAAEITRVLKQQLDVPIIWGGAGPTIEPDRSLQHADMVCVGEGEELIVDLAGRIDRGENYSNVPGLWLRRDGATIRNTAAPYMDLEDIAIPSF